MADEAGPAAPGTGESPCAANDEQGERSNGPWRDLGGWLSGAAKVGIGVVGAAALLGGILGPGDDLFDSLVTGAALFFVVYAIVVAAIAAGRATTILVTRNAGEGRSFADWWQTQPESKYMVIGIFVGGAVLVGLGLAAVSPISEAYRRQFSCQTPAITETGLDAPSVRAPSQVTVWVGDPNNQSSELLESSITWSIHTGGGKLLMMEGDRIMYRVTSAGQHILQADVINECGRAATVLIPISAD